MSGLANEFSDISDEPLTCTQLIEQLANDRGDEVLMRCSQAVESEFLSPLSRNEVQLLMDSSVVVCCTCRR